MSRLTGVALVLAGVPVVLWASYDLHRDWWTWWTRAVLGLAALGAISLGARLMHSGRDTDTPDAADDARV